MERDGAHGQGQGAHVSKTKFNRQLIARLVGTADVQGPLADMEATLG